MSHESIPYYTGSPELKPGGELRYFPDEDRTDVVFKTPGATFGTAEIADHFATNPVDQDSGSALVQAVGPDGRAQNIYLDMSHAVSKDKPWLVARLVKFPSTDPSADITVGQPWNSPFGTTEPVHAVVLPYKHGVNHDTVPQAPAGKVSQAGFGRRLIDQVLEP